MPRSTGSPVVASTALAGVKSQDHTSRLTGYTTYPTRVAGATHMTTIAMMAVSLQMAATSVGGCFHSRHPSSGVPSDDEADQQRAVRGGHEAHDEVARQRARRGRVHPREAERELHDVGEEGPRVPQREGDHEGDDDDGHERGRAARGAAPLAVAHDEEAQRRERPCGELRRHRDAERDAGADRATLRDRGDRHEADREDREVVAAAGDEDRPGRQHEHHLGRAERAIRGRASEPEPDAQQADRHRGHPQARIAQRRRARPASRAARTPSSAGK